MKTAWWFVVALAISCGFLAARPAQAQDWIRTGTGLGVEKARVAVADFAPKSDAAKAHAALFCNVVRADLDFSGIIEVVSKSYYPLELPPVPADLKYKAWSDPPASAAMVAFVNLSDTASDVRIEAWLYSVPTPPPPPVPAKAYP